MKKILLFIITIIIICSTQLNAQWIGMWELPVALSDSSSDNCNAFLFLSYYSSNDLIVFWDKSNDSLSTELWMDNLMDADTAEVILSDPGIHYTHPMVIDAQYYPYPDSILYVLYETDQNGNIDIYYIVMLPDGTFTDPEPLALSQHDDIQLSVGRENFYDAVTNDLNIVAWISNGCLYASTLINDNGQFFSEPVMIDSLGCNAPSVSAGSYSSNNILYEKEDSIGSFIYQVDYNGDGEWSAPILFFDSYESMNPTRAGLWGYECWSSYVDTSWRIALYDWGAIDLYDISSPVPFDPAVLGFSIGVAGAFGGDYIAITYPDNGVDEIFMSGTDWGGTDFVNFSNSGTMNRNPKFFGGEHLNQWYWHDYIIWESFRNGHWQLWSSNVPQSVGSISDEKLEDRFISSHPNPFTHETTLEFTLDAKSDVLIEVYDNRGMKVDEIANRNMTRGEHQLRWNGEGLPAGVYIIKMMVGDKAYTSKLIKSQ